MPADQTLKIGSRPPSSLPCPVCGTATHTRYAGLYDDRYGYPERFDLHSCDSCGHLHLNARFSPSDLSKLYTDYYPKRDFAIESFVPEMERTGFDSWMNGDTASAFRWVPRGVRVLDIGCGMGATLAYHRNRGCEAVGVETDEKTQEVAKRYGLDIRQGIFNPDEFDPESFDYVTLDQVAEHVVDPHALIGGIARVLRPGGTVFLTTPNARGMGARLFGRTWLNWHPPYHLQFYSRRSMRIVAEKAGLVLVRRRIITASEWQYYQWRHILSFPEFAERSDFWSHAETPRKPVSHRTERLMALARRYRLQQWITRAVDALGLGDNQIFELRKPL